MTLVHLPLSPRCRLPPPPYPLSPQCSLIPSASWPCISSLQGGLPVPNLQDHSPPLQSFSGTTGLLLRNHLCLLSPEPLWSLLQPILTVCLPIPVPPPLWSPRLFARPSSRLSIPPPPEAFSSPTAPTGMKYNRT